MGSLYCPIANHKKETVMTKFLIVTLLAVVFSSVIFADGSGNSDCPDACAARDAGGRMQTSMEASTLGEIGIAQRYAAEGLESEGFLELDPSPDGSFPTTTRSVP